MTDTTAPAISGVADLSLGLSEATIVWTTDELAVSHLEYGTTQGYGQSVTLPATGALVHTAILLNLSPNTIYYYCIHATDLVGNTRNSCVHTFQTAAHTIVEDTTPPNVTLITVAPITTTSATINFTTDIVGNARVEYGTTAGYGESTPLNATLSLNHSVVLSNLTPNTLYHYRVITSDDIGNETITSDETFTTESIAGVDVDVTVPETVNSGTGQAGVDASVVISAVDTVSVSTSAATITWHTDLPSDSQIEYGDSENFGSLSTLSSTLTTSHSVALTGLAQNTNYIFRVKSKPLGATMATISQNHEFNTLNHSIPIVAPANIISVSSGSVTNMGATISWTTDKGATSLVEYGLDTTYGLQSTLNSNLTTSHSVSVGDLSSGTTYHCRVKSIDEAGNITFSEDYTFTTSGTSSGVAVPHVTPTPEGVAVTPVVDVNGADSQVIFEINEENPDNVENIVIERDGEVIYEGTSQTFTDTNLINGHDYHYSVSARGGGGSRSSSVNITIAPQAGIRQVQFNESGTLASSTPAFHFVNTWKKGDKDIEIEHLQEILVADKDSYPEKYVTGYFGSLTEAALKRFQAKHGLPQTGVIDAATQAKLNTVSHSETKLNVPHDYVVFSTDLKRGNQGEAVKDLQQYLIHEGSYLEALVSGYFGRLTENAVKKFQAKYGVSPVSGFVGYKTRHKMQQLTGL
ncbi:MAG: fibronectin type III domain-containing protein [Patescibacteria group bacterium]